MSKKCSTMKCSARCLFILQLLLLTLRQVFDFMGHMWVPILFNFVAIIAVIIGLFGLQQLRQTYLTLYAAFQLFSIGWNLFVCAFYFNLGSLNRESSHLLNFGTGSRSWWFENGPDCVVHFEPIVLNVSLSSPPLHQAAAAVSNAYQPSNDGEHSLNGAIHSFPFLAPVKVTNCAVDYYLIEGGQAIIHCLVSLFGLLMAMYAICLGSSKDDASITRQSIGSGMSALPPYSIRVRNSHSEPLTSTSASLRRSTRARSSQHSISSRVTPRKLKKRRRYSQQLQSPVSKLLNSYGDVDSVSSDSYGAHTNSAYYGSPQSVYSRHTKHSRSQIYDVRSAASTLPLHERDNLSQHNYDTLSGMNSLPPPPPPHHVPESPSHNYDAVSGITNTLPSPPHHLPPPPSTPSNSDTTTSFQAPRSAHHQMFKFPQVPSSPNQSSVTSQDSSNLPTPFKRTSSLRQSFQFPPPPPPLHQTGNFHHHPQSRSNQQAAPNHHQYHANNRSHPPPQPQPRSHLSNNQQFQQYHSNNHNYNHAHHNYLNHHQKPSPIYMNSETAI